jgi:hypothetical protein
MTCTEAELDPARAHAVERRRLLGHRHRMAQVVVEHQCAEADARRGRGRRGQGNEGAQLGADVISHLEEVESRRFGFPGCAHYLGHVVRDRLKAEAKRAHLVDPNDRMASILSRCGSFGPRSEEQGPNKVTLEGVGRFYGDTRLRVPPKALTPWPLPPLSMPWRRLGLEYPRAQLAEDLFHGLPSGRPLQELHTDQDRE